jgi:integrase
MLANWFRGRYGAAAPAAWNRELATLRAAVGWWRRRGWLAIDPTGGLVRRRERIDRTRALTRGQLERLFAHRDLPLRERTLWRLLYETARANELLALDVEDLDLANRGAPVHSKGGAIEWIFWQTGSAQLLPRLLAGRTSGPVFSPTVGRPATPPPWTWTRPAGGRFSYRRAAELFNVRTGWTLHQLRHSALTHAAEDGTNLPLLLARSRHASVRSLERYAAPDPRVTRGAGRNRAWSAVQGSSILVVTSRGSASDTATLRWMWSSLVLNG